MLISFLREKVFEGYLLNEEEGPPGRPWLRNFEATELCFALLCHVMADYYLSAYNILFT